MCVIDHQGKLIRHAHRLRPAFHLGRRKGSLYLRPIHTEMPADGDGRQRIVNVEFSGGSRLHRKLSQPAGRKTHAQTPAFVQERDVLRPQIRRRINTVSFQPAGAVFRDRLPVGIIPVHDPYSALPEQQTLTVQVIIEILMLILPDMIRLQIRKNSKVKDKSLGSVQHQPLGRNFHHHRITACVRHHPKIFLYQIRLRCCVLRVDMGIPDDDFNGADQPHLSACLLQNRFHQISGGGFPLRSRDADDLHLLCRMPKICRRDKRHSIAGIFHPDHRDVTAIGKFHLVLHQQGGRSGFRRRRRILMSVCLRSGNADEQTALRHLSGIIYSICYFLFHRASHALV